MEYSESDLDAVNARLTDVERRRAWMADVVDALKARDGHTRAAERQQIQFAEMAEAMRELRSRIEQSIISARK